MRWGDPTPYRVMERTTVIMVLLMGCGLAVLALVLLVEGSF